MKANEIPFEIRLTKFFEALTAAGYFAKQAHTCCASCGWNAAPATGGVVFYNRQDKADVAAGYVYLSWRGDAVAIMVAADCAGLIAEYNGDDKKILVRQDTWSAWVIG